MKPNNTQYPSVIIPFTHADPALDPKDTDFIPLSAADIENEAKCRFLSRALMLILY